MKAIQLVYHESWLRSEQRRTYDYLVLRPVTSPPACCQKSNLLTQLNFVDGYSVLPRTVSIFLYLDDNDNINNIPSGLSLLGYLRLEGHMKSPFTLTQSIFTHEALSCQAQVSLPNELVIGSLPSFKSVYSNLTSSFDLSLLT